MNKYSRLGIGVLIVVWATVLLVPSFNYYFRLQVRNEEGVVLAGFLPPEIGFNFWAAMAKRYPENRDILLLVAQEFPVSVDEEGNLQEGDGIDAVQPLPTQVPGLYIPLNSVDEVRARRAQRYGKLRQKFPRDPLLVAAEIKKIVEAFRPERQGGELSSDIEPAKRPKGYVAPERRKEKTNFTPAGFQKAIELCRLGQKLEPDNGYFDWMESFFLFQSWQDELGLKALEKVWRKREFNDYTLDTARSHIKALETAWGRPLLIEEKSGPLNPIGLPFYAQNREYMRILSWESIKARRRGDHARAIRIMAASARAMIKMREGSVQYIDALVAGALEGIAWKSATYDLQVPAGKKLSNQEIRQWRQKELQAYTAAHGRPKLAEEAATSREAEKCILAQMRASRNDMYGIPHRVFAWMTLWWIAGVKLLLLLIVPGLIVGAMALGKHIPGMRRWLCWEESRPLEVPSAREVWNGMLACIGWRAWGVGLCALLIVGPLVCLSLGGIEAVYQRLQEWRLLDDLLGTPDANMPTGWGFRFYMELISVASLQTPWKAVVIATPVLFGTLHVAWRAVVWQQRAGGEAIKKISLARLGDFMVMSILIGAWFALALVEEIEDFPALHWVLGLIVLFCASVLLGEKFLAWRKRPHRRAAVRYGLRLLQRSLFSWLVVGSVIYLLTLLATTTVRREADTMMNRVVAVGEVRAAQSEK